jgi:hypothetical protein
MSFVTDAGVINSTPPFVSAPPDATGGRGSFLGNVLDTLTNGINAFAQAKISSEITKSLGQGIATVDDEGNVVYRAAPAADAPAQISPKYAAKSFFGSTAGILTIAGVAVGVVILFAVVGRK